MVSITKIHISYELKQPLPLYVEPGSPIEGRMMVTNNGEKELKLKELFIDLIERYDQDDGEGLSPIKNRLYSYRINTMGIIKSGETQVYPFNIILPRWKRKKGRRIQSWHLALYFKQKTKLVASRGFNKANATCILPVQGTMVAPSFGDPNLIQGKKKRR